MAYESLPTVAPGDYGRASWANKVDTNLDDHEARIVDLEDAAVGEHALLSGTHTDTTPGTVQAGDIVVGEGSPATWTRKSIGTAGQVLTSDGSTADWQDPAASISWRGAWDSGTAYVTDDMVEHNGSSYIATSNSTGNEPGVGSPDPWDLVAEKGADGADGGVVGSWEGEWGVATNYTEGDVVQHEGSSYRASEATIGDEPGVGSPNPWDLVAAKGDPGATPVVTRVVGITIDGGGAAITTGVKGFVRIPFSGTITKVTLLSTDASATAGDIVIDLWLDTFANYPPTDADSITASAPPELDGANAYEDGTLTGWDTAVTAGDVLGFHVDSVAGLTRVTLTLEIAETEES